jgi:hypothetical protein
LAVVEGAVFATTRIATIAVSIVNVRRLIVIDIIDTSSSPYSLYCTGMLVSRCLDSRPSEFLSKKQMTVCNKQLSQK